MDPEDHKKHEDMLFAISTDEAAELEIEAENSIFDFSRKIIWNFEFLKISNGFWIFKLWISNILNH